MHHFVGITAVIHFLRSPRLESFFNAIMTSEVIVCMLVHYWSRSPRRSVAISF
jgi:hypothetical protein